MQNNSLKKRKYFAINYTIEITLTLGVVEILTLIQIRLQIIQTLKFANRYLPGFLSIRILLEGLMNRRF